MKPLRSYLVFYIIIFSIFLQGCTTVISAAGDKRDLSTQYDDEKIGFTCTSDFSDIKGEFRASCNCLLYTSPSPRDRTRSRMPSSA